MQSPGSFDRCVNPHTAFARTQNNSLYITNDGPISRPLFRRGAGRMAPGQDLVTCDSSWLFSCFTRDSARLRPNDCLIRHRDRRFDFATVVIGDFRAVLALQAARARVPGPRVARWRSSEIGSPI